ncbi:MAG: hypothetical protein Tsb0016_24800 [Sphingomonadales bacterium]
MAAKAVKFNFDQAFDGGASQRAREEKARFEAALAEARAQAHAEGHGEGHAQAMAEIEARLATLTQNLLQRLEDVVALQNAAEDNAERMATQLAMAVARSLCQRLITQVPLAEIEGLIAESFALVRDEPRIVIRVAETLLDPLKERLPNLSASQAFAGKVVLIGDDSIIEGDCLIEWADGGLERKMSEIMAAIEHSVGRFLNRDAAAAAASENVAMKDIDHG